MDIRRGVYAPRLLILLMLALVAVLAGLLGLSESGYSQRSDLAARVAEVRDRQLQASKLLLALTQGESAMRGYLVSGNPELREPIEAAKRRARALLDVLDSGTSSASPAARVRIAELRSLTEQCITLIERRLETFHMGGLDAVRSDNALPRLNGFRTMESIHDLVQKFEAEESDALIDAFAEWRQHQSRVRIGLALLAGLSMILVVVAGTLVYRQLRQRASETSELQERVRLGVSELAALSSHLQYVSEREKKALARELHDALGGLLVATKMDVAWIRNHLERIDPAIDLRFTRIQRSLDQGVDFKRRVVEQLRPTLLDNMGLFSALRWQFEDTCSRASLKATTDLPETELMLTSDAAIALFRVAQEAVTNIMKHSRASAAWLAVTVDADSLHLSVADNGRGMPPQASPGGGHGLSGMRHRITALGGQLIVRASEHGGVEIRVRVPLQRVIAEQPREEGGDSLYTAAARTTPAKQRS